MQKKENWENWHWENPQQKTGKARTQKREGISKIRKNIINKKWEEYLENSQLKKITKTRGKFRKPTKNRKTVKTKTQG